MFFTRMVVSDLEILDEEDENEERMTPCDSRYVFVSWITCVSARASLTAALSESGLRISALEIFILSAMEEATASLYSKQTSVSEHKRTEDMRLSREDVRSYTTSPN